MIKSIVNNELEDNGDYFDAELTAEWFMNNELDDARLSLLTGEQCDLMYDSIEYRWGNESAERFDTRVLPLISG
tara:strand:- start:1304 stop:1525 length:222 start_codon:yes stop_codon:yes gene_type:complete